MSFEDEAKQQVKDALGDLSFPAGKDRIVAHVQAYGSESALRLVRAIPVAEYQNSGEVAVAIRADRAVTDQTPVNPIEAETGENRKHGRERP